MLDIILLMRRMRRMANVDDGVDWWSGGRCFEAGERFRAGV